VSTARRSAHPEPDVGRAANTSAVAAVALYGLTIATAGGLSRVFSDHRWEDPVLAAVTVAHLVSWAARRARLANPVGAGLTLVAVSLLGMWMVLGTSTSYGIPTGATLSALKNDMSVAHTAFSNLAAPVPAVSGFVLISMLTVCLVAILADWAAFRLQATFEALVPALAAMIVVSVIGRTAYRFELTAAFILAAALFASAHGASRRRLTNAGFASSSGARSSFGQATAGLTGLSVLAALVVGPLVPGSHSQALVSVRNSGLGGTQKRTTVSPLVDIRPRLINNADTELFTVKAAAPEYWRLTSLDYFDGNAFTPGPPGKGDAYTSVSDHLPIDTPQSSPQRVSQQFSIEALDEVWAPAAYAPTDIAKLPGASWDPNTQSIISKKPTTNGETYTVTSVVPHYTSGELATADDGSRYLTAAQLAHYTQLPAQVPSNIKSEAQQVVAAAGATTLFAKARALQDFFRAPGAFNYSLNVPAGHGKSAIEDFLFVTKTGYCEQFAATYVVMARELGLPTRVAVGFTPGVERNGTWHVFGLDAHAWPEVFLGKYGWVPFDPTPGRGIPGATAYTGLAAAQAPTPASLIPAHSTTTTTPGGAALPGAPRGKVKNPGQVLIGSGVGDVGSRAPGQSNGLPAGLILATGAGGLAIVWLAGVPTAQALARRRRRNRARSPAERVLVAWHEAAESLADAGAARLKSETFPEHAARICLTGRLRGEVADAMRALAESAETAAYAPSGPGRGASPSSSPSSSPGTAGAGTGRSPDPLAAASRASSVERALRSAASPLQRVGWRLDPRPKAWAGRSAWRRAGPARKRAGRGPHRRGY
jgi:transglutaminase-like putative cysteine protease